MGFQISKLSISKITPLVSQQPMDYFAIVSLAISSMAFCSPVIADTFPNITVPAGNNGGINDTQSDSSQVVNIYPARADGRRDHTQNSFRVEGRIAYQVRPDGHIDWIKPHYISSAY